MRAAPIADGCGCFPSGRHYPGIAHLLVTVIRGLVDEFRSEQEWHDVPVALIDVETTGRDGASDRIVEVGIVVGRKGEVVARYNWLVNPGIPIPNEARTVHGIGDDDVKDAPRFEAIAHEIAAALAGCVPAAYNAAFDKAFLAAEFGRIGSAATESGSPRISALRRDIEWLDPLVWAREVQREEKSRALGEVASRLGIRLENAHRASDDAEAALLVFYALANDTRVPRSYGALVQEQRRLGLLHADERRFWRT